MDPSSKDIHDPLNLEESWKNCNEQIKADGSNKYRATSRPFTAKRDDFLMGSMLRAIESFKENSDAVKKVHK